MTRHFFFGTKKSATDLFICLFVFFPYPSTQRWPLFLSLTRPQTRTTACVIATVHFVKPSGPPISNPGTDIIEFGADVTPGTFLLTLCGLYEFDAALGDLNVKDDIIITGGGEASTIIDANGIDRVFNIATGVSVTLSHLSIVNGDFTVDPPVGGGILNRGNLNLNGVKFQNNTAGNGGAIYNLSNITATNVVLSGNGSLGYGGAIYNDSDANLNMTYSDVSGNYAQAAGGGIYISGGVTSLSSVAVDNNTAVQCGGGVQNVGIFIISDSSITNNTSDDGGGIGVQVNGSVEIINCIFSGNSAQGTDLGGGGAVFNYQGQLSISNSTFAGNNAYGEGGGAINSKGRLIISNNCVFSNNTALYHIPNPPMPGSSPGLGGALLLVLDGKVSITDSAFSGNIAGVSGGAIYNDNGSNLEIASSILEGNSADDTCEGFRGGAILNQGILTLTGSTVIKNTAPVSGGGIATSLSSATITSSTISGNSAENGGGIFNFNGGVMKIDGSTLNGNTTDNPSGVGFGGAIFNDAGSDALISNSTFSGNSSDRGGAISNSALEDPNTGFGGMTLLNVTITENTANVKASAMFNGGGTVKLANTIIDGTCNDWGWINENGGDLNLDSPISYGGNIESPGDTCGLLNVYDLVDVVDPLLDSLTANGGTTLAHDLQTGSPAIDAGVSDYCPSYDQRGLGRPIDGDDDTLALCDSGAVEYYSLTRIILIENLITHYFWNILDRAPASGGLTAWKYEIMRINSLGVDIKEGFIALAKVYFNCQEYLDRGRTDAQYVTDLFRTFFDRDPLPNGLNYWTNQLSLGVSRNLALNFFVFSDEFNSYMEQIFDVSQSRPENNIVNDYARGLLGRFLANDGFNYWLGRFRNEQCNGDSQSIRDLALEIASSFILTPEYQNRNRDDLGYIEDLFDAILRRTGNWEGVNDYVNGLGNGIFTREGLLHYFVNSPEFQDRVQKVIDAGCFTQ